MPDTVTEWLAATTANDTTGSNDDSESDARVAGLADGGWVVVWTDDSGGTNDVVARRYDYLGNPVGGEFVVNLNVTDFDQYAPDIAALPNGGWVITWTDNSTGDPDVRGSIFDADGTLVSNDFLIHANGNIPDVHSSISVFDDGSFNVAFEYNSTHIAIGDRNVSAAGVVGGFDNIYSNANHDTTNPVTATLTDGTTVAIFELNTGLLLERSYDRSGHTIPGTTFSYVGGATTGINQAPDVAALSGGGFVVVWVDDDGDGAGNVGISATISTNSGAVVTSAFSVNSTTTGTQGTPRVTALSDGGFIVIWDDDAGAGTFRGQRFDATGTMVGIEFNFNAGPDATPDVGELADGRIIVSYTETGTGTNNVEFIVFDPRDGTIADPVLGTSGADHLTATIAGAYVYGQDGDDFITGMSGDDHLTGGAGNDTIDGGTGTDTALYSGFRSSYVINTVGGIMTVNGAGWSDTLSNIETLEFGDGTTIDIAGLNAMATSSDLVLAPEEWNNIGAGISYIDGDGDDATHYQIWDNEGANSFWLQYIGTIDASSGYIITADQLAGLWVQADAASSAQTLWIRAYDGNSWGVSNSFSLTTNSPPSATMDDLILEDSEWSLIGGSVVYTDADGDAATQYQLWDDSWANSFWVSGIGEIDASSGYTITAAELAGLWVQGEIVGGTQTLWIRADDGNGWGDWDSFDLLTNSPPTAEIADLSLAPSGWNNIGTSIVYGDIDTNFPTQFEIWDSEGSNNFWVQFIGTVDASHGYIVPADPLSGQLSGLWVQGDASAGTQTLYIRAFDGFEWGNWDSFDLTTL